MNDLSAPSGKDYLQRARNIAPLIAEYACAIESARRLTPQVVKTLIDGGFYRMLQPRFLGGNPPVNTWIPFGGGVRRCIGAGFSLMEGVAVLREVLGRYDITLPRGHRDHPRVRNITSVPRHGARIVVTPRRQPV